MNDENDGFTPSLTPLPPEQFGRVACSSCNRMMIEGWVIPMLRETLYMHHNCMVAWIDEMERDCREIDRMTTPGPKGAA